MRDNICGCFCTVLLAHKRLATTLLLTPTFLSNLILISFHLLQLATGPVTGNRE